LSTEDQQGAGSIRLSVVAPAHNEQDNLEPLIEQIATALGESAIAFELIVIDDGSTDRTRHVLAEQMVDRPWLRALTMTKTPPGRGNGQSAAFYAGIRAAAGELVALLDADLQNDPADIPQMIQKLDAQGADMVQGDRSANRRDNIVRTFSSWIGRTFRRCLLGDTIRDTGCSLRVFKREVGLALPLQYRGMHRFIPFYAQELGYVVVEAAVNHRPRVAGVAKYGVWNRALPGLRDLIAVRWMRRRLRSTDCRLIDAKESGP
jgi:dolichol-phosphate mannosyltransferase